MNCFYCDKNDQFGTMYVVAGYSVCKECKKEKEDQELKEMKKFISSIDNKPIGADKYDDV